MKRFYINRIKELLAEFYELQFEASNIDDVLKVRDNEISRSEFIKNILLNPDDLLVEYINYTFDSKQFKDFVKRNECPYILFDKNDKKVFYLEPKTSEKINLYEISEQTDYKTIYTKEVNFDDYFHEDGKIVIIACFKKETLFNISDKDTKTLTPLRRFFKLMSNDRKDISYLYIYAVFNGLVKLSLPLGIQAIINLVMGAQYSTSLFILIAVVVVGVFFAGILQIIQLYIVEGVQQRIFLRSAFEFTYRIPKFNTDTLSKYHAPEMVNRFFDTLTLQKGLPKLLIDFITSLLYVVFGLILLSLYHPLFLIFGVVTITVLYVILKLTSPQGLETNLKTSKYKYQVAHWLEELARALGTFKSAGTNTLPVKKTDNLVGKYLNARNKHFKVLVTQYMSIVIFKTVIIGAVLILGAQLVINRQINLGQFVAAEIIVILLLDAIEKMFLSIETIYDVITGTEKLGNVTDLPLERITGFNGKSAIEPGPIKITIKNLNYLSPINNKPVIKNIDLEIEKGERVAISGFSGSGKSTLLSIISLYYEGYKGTLLFNGYNVNNFKLDSLRSRVSDNFNQELIFSGTLWDNITLGRDVNPMRISEVTEIVGLTDFVQSLEKGYQTELLPEDKRVSGGVFRKIILARTILDNPSILILEDFEDLYSVGDNENLVKYIMSSTHVWTLFLKTSNKNLIEQCDRMIIMDNGYIIFNDKPELGLSKSEYKKYFH